MGSLDWIARREGRNGDWERVATGKEKRERKNRLGFN